MDRDAVADAVAGPFARNFYERETILNRLRALPFQQCRHRINTVDGQPAGPARGVLVLVRGVLDFVGLDGEQHAHDFSQTFQLMPTPQGGFYILNDLFRVGLAALTVDLQFSNCIFACLLAFLMSTKHGFYCVVLYCLHDGMIVWRMNIYSEIKCYRPGDFMLALAMNGAVLDLLSNNLLTKISVPLIGPIAKIKNEHRMTKEKSGIKHCLCPAPASSVTLVSQRSTTGGGILVGGSSGIVKKSAAE
ncbi:hypothetical protein NL676_019905 [Syzygium grande]|nr:hypothetical protein NL676_019905 [Syzygium grande]